MRIVLIFLALFAISAGEAVTQSGVRGPEVRSVEVVNAGDLDPARMRAAVRTRATTCRSGLLALPCALGLETATRRAYLDEATLREDEQRLQLLHARAGYPAARVHAEVNRLPRGGVEVRFLIWPGEPLIVRSVRVQGLDEVPGAPGLPPLHLRPGERLTIEKLEAAQRVVAGRLAAEGYAFAQVGLGSDLPAEGGPVDLVLDVRPGPLAEFGPVTVHAEYPLRATDVVPRLAFDPGDRFSPAALEHTIERLYRIPAVERVQVQPGPGDEGGNVVATEIFVVAAEPEGLQLEGAISSYSCIEGIVGWTSRYFLGAPRVVSVSAGAANLFAEPLRSFPCSGVGEEEFAEPDFFVRGDFSQALGPDTWLHLGGGYSRESAPRAFIQTGLMARVSLVHELRRGLDLTVGYSPERRDNPVAGTMFCAVHGICAGDDLAALTRMSVLAPVEVELAFGPPRARRIDPGAPLTAAWTYPPLPNWSYGGRVSFMGAGAATLSDIDFGRLQAETSFTLYPGRTYQLAGRLRAGSTTGDEVLPPQVRHYGGGPFGVRGVEANMLGPKALSITRARMAELDCAPVAGGCDGVEVNPALVRPRPLGGESVIELSLEARVWASPYLQLALFTDFGAVFPGSHPDDLSDIARNESVYTPGIGVLALTPLGPIRLDVAYDPTPARRYPLLTRDELGVDQVHLGNVIYDPVGFGDPSAWERFRRRLQFQLTMQQPF